uniref:Uncharacterized protein n=1 Tax=Caenorhabditis japonica TaxID=281687 RepID=A0A8R1EHW8_CAEJA
MRAGTGSLRLSATITISRHLPPPPSSTSPSNIIIVAAKGTTMNDEDGSEDDDDDDDNVRHGQSPRIATERTKRCRD